MMTITSTHRGRTLKRVTFDGIAQLDDEQLARSAMIQMSETRSSLFGYDVERHDNGTATVTLHTD